MSKQYVTVQGDMWDGIAYTQLGDERHMSALLQANKEYLDYYIFPAGIALTLPDVAPDTPSTLPPWRRK